MPTLQIRHLPQELYDKLVAVAEAERRSLAQEAIVLLERALSLEEARVRRERALESLLSRKLSGSEDIAEVVRQDRDR